ncbi:hypothetical protein M0R45_031759 [Rubus argutus]|uniref:Uncharacterized protein n=1 Tax=Rubus argutus TaxID=59490 RepID=A0AAW1WH58_RUBAR
MGCGLIEEVMGLANWVRASRGIWGQNRERRRDDCSGDVIFDGEERSLGSRAEQGSSSGQMRLRLVCRRWKERRDLIGRLLLVLSGGELWSGAAARAADLSDARAGCDGIDAGLRLGFASLVKNHGGSGRYRGDRGLDLTDLDWVDVVIIDFELQGMERLKDEEK